MNPNDQSALRLFRHRRCPRRNPRHYLVEKIPLSYTEHSSIAIRQRTKWGFGERLQEFRKSEAATLGYQGAKVENEKVELPDNPSDDLIVKLAKALDAHADELQLMVRKIPPQIKKRVLERPEAYRRKLAELDDQALDVVMQGIDGLTPKRKR